MSVADDNPADLLRAARGLVSSGDKGLGGAWSRSAAHLARQALELALDQFWRARAPDIQAAPRRAQLICLRSYLHDPMLARHAAFTWAALSQACHHHPYELTPTAPELAGWVETIEALLVGLREAVAAGRG